MLAETLWRGFFRSRWGQGKIGLLIAMAPFDNRGLVFHGLLGVRVFILFVEQILDFFLGQALPDWV